MSAPSEEVDYSNPASVVRCFIHAMNQWEIQSWQVQTVCQSTKVRSCDVDIKKRVAHIFERFCTSKKRKFGRQGSFQNPPEYDPHKEHVINTQVHEAGKRAYVTTVRQAVLGGGCHRYALVQQDGRWLIDTLKREWEGEWQNAIL